MAQSRGKDFEHIIRDAFESVPGVSIDRIPDQTMGFKGACNISDFIVYKEPYEYYIECKTVHGNTLPFSNISTNQWQGMLEKSKIPGVFAGVICWWVDRDVTRYIPIQLLNAEKRIGSKSIRYDYGFAYFNESTCKVLPPIDIQGKKKRVFFDYDMEVFFNEITNANN